MKDSQALIYNKDSGEIKIIDKSQICNLLKSFNIKESMTYEEIAKKCNFNKIQKGIYNLSSKNNSSQLICLIDITLKEFKNILKKKGFKIKEDNIITLYHGSQNPILRPIYLGGKEYNDYGNGLYLTPYPELAKEWAVANDDIMKDGYLYKLSIDIFDLNILDFDKEGDLAWMAELLSHRDADESQRYKLLTPKFIKKYKINTDKYDILRGWRADSSYFRIAKIFVRDGLNRNLINKCFHLGDLGIQYFIKSKKAFDKLEKEYKPISSVSYEIYNAKYNLRDKKAREELNKIEYSDENDLSDVFSNYIKD